MQHKTVFGTATNVIGDGAIAIIVDYISKKQNKESIIIESQIKEA